MTMSERRKQTGCDFDPSNHRTQSVDWDCLGDAAASVSRRPSHTERFSKNLEELEGGRGWRGRDG